MSGLIYSLRDLRQRQAACSGLVLLQQDDMVQVVELFTNPHRMVRYTPMSMELAATALSVGVGIKIYQTEADALRGLLDASGWGAEDISRMRSRLDQEISGGHHGLSFRRARHYGDEAGRHCDG